MFCQHRLLLYNGIWKLSLCCRPLTYDDPASGFNFAAVPERCFFSSAGSRSRSLLPPLEDTEDPNWCEVNAGCEVELWCPLKPKWEVGPPAVAPLKKKLDAGGITVNLYNFYERLTIPSPTGGGGCLTVEHSQFVIDGISCRCAQVMRRLLFGRGQVPQDPVDGGHL